MKKSYTKDYKDEVVRQHLEDGRTIKSLNAQYQLGTGTLNSWLKQLRKECQENPNTKDKIDSYQVVLNLKKENNF